GRGSGVAGEARGCVRALPDLPERALALRAPPRRARPRLSADVRRPDARSADGTVGREPFRRARATNGQAAGSTGRRTWQEARDARDPLDLRFDRPRGVLART